MSSPRPKLIYWPGDFLFISVRAIVLTSCFGHRLAGMRVCGYFGDMDTDVPLDDPDAHNMLVVLKKDA